MNEKYILLNLRLLLTGSERTRYMGMLDNVY